MVCHTVFLRSLRFYMSILSTVEGFGYVLACDVNRSLRRSMFMMFSIWLPKRSRKRGEMIGKNTAAFGIYKTKAGAETAVDTLQSAGFRMEDISALLPNNLGSQEMKTEKATKAPEGATAGV